MKSQLSILRAVEFLKDYYIGQSTEARNALPPHFFMYRFSHTEHADSFLEVNGPHRVNVLKEDEFGKFLKAHIQKHQSSENHTDIDGLLLVCVITMNDSKDSSFFVARFDVGAQVWESCFVAFDLVSNVKFLDTLLEFPSLMDCLEDLPIA